MRETIKNSIGGGQASLPNIEEVEEEAYSMELTSTCATTSVIVLPRSFRRPEYCREAESLDAMRCVAAGCRAENGAKECIV